MGELNKVGVPDGFIDLTTLVSRFAFVTERISKNTPLNSNDIDGERNIG